MSLVKSKILDQLADNFPTYLRRDLSKCIDLVFDEIIGALARNQRVELRSFGSFQLRQQKARLGRNPRNGTRVAIAAKLGVHWKMSKELFQKLNQDTNRDE